MEPLILLYHYGYLNLFGTDLEKNADLSKLRASENNIKLVLNNNYCTNIGFSDNEFDFIIMTEVIEHFNFRPDSLFEEINRILKPGGRIFITTPNAARLNNRIKLLLGKNIYYDLSETSAGAHFREYTMADFRYLFEKYGLKIVEGVYQYFDYPDQNNFIKTFNKIAGKIYPPLLSNLVIVAEKNK